MTHNVMFVLHSTDICSMNTPSLAQVSSRFSGPYTVRYSDGQTRRRFTFAQALELARGNNALVLDRDGLIVLEDVTAAFITNEERP